MATNNCQYSTRYCWDADKVKALIRLRAELSPLFTGKRNASKYAWAVVERELNVPLPLSKIIKKWNNLLQEYKAIKISEEPKRREWPFFTLMDVYFSDQVNDPSLRLFSSTKTLKESLDESVFEDDPIIASAIAAATSGACMEIDELLKRQKERRANEAKYAVEKNFSSKATDYSINGNKPNVITVKNTNFIHSQKDNLNSMKVLTDQQEVIKNEKNVPPRPIFQQPQSPPPPTIHNKYPDPNTIDQYLLSWNNFLGNMSRGFHTLQKDEKMVDVTIAAGGKIFKAHKLVLSVCSPYFQEIFLENPSNHPILLMADVEANHMAGLLNFMYSGQVNVKYEDLPVFLKVAEAMKIKGLHTEKPEEQNLKEIQFSRENNSTDFQVLNSSSIPIPVDIATQSLPTSITKGDEGACQPSFHSSDHANKNIDTSRQGINTVNFEQTKNKFSIFKANASKKILDHTKQQKYLAKRKIYVHCESDLKEKRMSNILENDPYNNNSQSKMMCTQQMTPHGENFNTEEVLNLAQNGVSNIPSNFLPINTADLKNMGQYDQTSFTEIRKDLRTPSNSIENETNSYLPKSCEDGNNNICIQRNTPGQKNNFSGRDEMAFYNDDNNKNNDINSGCNINDNNNNNNYDTDNNKNHKANANDDTSIDNNNSSTVLVSKQADNNNNVFHTSNTNLESKENDSTSTTDGAKTKFTIKANSSFY